MSRIDPSCSCLSTLFPYVKLPTHRARLLGKEISYILCPLTPPIPIERDRAHAGQKNRTVPFSFISGVR